MFNKTVAELSAALKAKKVSSVELTQGFLDRISKYRDLNAFISLDPGDPSPRPRPRMHASPRVRPARSPASRSPRRTFSAPTAG